MSLFIRIFYFLIIFDITIDNSFSLLVILKRFITILFDIGVGFWYIDYIRRKKMITKIEVLRKGDGKRWSCNEVLITDDKGNSFKATHSDATLKREQLKLKLLLAGANETDLEDFEQVMYSIGYDEGYDSGYSNGGGDTSGM